MFEMAMELVKEELPNTDTKILKELLDNEVWVRQQFQKIYGLTGRDTDIWQMQFKIAETTLKWEKNMIGLHVDRR